MNSKVKIFIVFISFIFLLVIFLNNTVAEKEKINGVSFVAPPSEIGKEEILKPQKVVKANYLSIMPYGFIPEKGKEILFDKEWQWWGEKTEGTKRSITIAQQEGYKVMLKPHVWKKHGEYTGDHCYSKEKDWQLFQSSFKKYILHYAKIAESLKVSIFCVGTEWEKFVSKRPGFWKNLIVSVREVFNGEVCYAANWDEYKRVSFWKELDYIGVDAYFPVSNKKTPSAKEIIEGLSSHKKELKEYSDSLNKKVLFTEYGYRSRDYSAGKPWESDKGGELNEQAQANAYRGFYNCFWKEEFVAGGFLWKWFHNHEKVGENTNTGFTPQNKKAEKEILYFYSN